MLITRRTIATLAIAVLAGSACVSGSADSALAPPPSTVEAATAETDEGVSSVTVGLILNSASPTATRDLHLADVMRAAATELTVSDVEVGLETAAIDDVNDVGSAVDSLVSLGVTVIATSCDDTTMAAVVDAAIEQEILVVTGCVAIPRPELDISDRLFIDLASLDDAAGAITEWLMATDQQQVGVISSTLIPDVDQACLDVETQVSELPTLDVAGSVDFVELVDPPADVVASATSDLEAATIIVVCALPPALGDLTDALRDAGFDQPIVVPWFGEPQNWNDETSDVFVIGPSSRHGDDPAAEVQELYDQLDEPRSIDVVAADALAAVVSASTNDTNTGSRRIADALRDSDRSTFSGSILIEPAGDRRSVIREYRVLEVVGGDVEFSTVITPS